jgi:hypothetical protein
MESALARRVSQLLKQEIDWVYLFQVALHHGTLPLLFWNLNKLGSDDIPKVALTQLKNAFHAIAQRNLYITGELLRLLNLFQNVGIRAFPFKGPALAAAAYGNLSLRHFGDLDILMPQEDILRAKEILVLQGYHAKLDLTESEELTYVRSHHDYKFVRAHDGAVIEIQWGVTERLFAFPINFEDIWRRRQEISLAGARVCNLSFEDSLLLLCVHGAKHRWEQLSWICDIAELINIYQQRIDWERLIEDARTSGGERMLLLGLFLARDLLNIALPERILRKIHDDPQIEFLANQVNQGLFGDPAHPMKLYHERPFFYLYARERLRDKVALLRRYFPEYFFRAVGRVRKIGHFASTFLLSTIDC